MKGQLQPRLVWWGLGMATLAPGEVWGQPWLGLGTATVGFTEFGDSHDQVEGTPSCLGEGLGTAAGPVP